MCSLFGLIDFKECLSTHTKNKILNTLARECQVRGTVFVLRRPSR